MVYFTSFTIYFAQVRDIRIIVPENPMSVSMLYVQDKYVDERSTVRVSSIYITSCSKLSVEFTTVQNVFIKNFQYVKQYHQQRNEHSS